MKHLPCHRPEHHWLMLFAASFLIFGTRTVQPHGPPSEQDRGQVCIDTDTTVDILGIREGAAGDELGLKQLRTRFWSPPSGFIMPKLSGVQMKQCSTMFGARSGQIQHHA